MQNTVSWPVKKNKKHSWQVNLNEKKFIPCMQELPFVNETSQCA